MRSVHTPQPLCRPRPQVRFHPSSRCVISGSIDGLVAVHDTCKPLASDEAFVAAVNVDTSVEELGTYGAHGERLWVRVLQAGRSGVGL